jgi:prophage regulatory protein
LDKKMSTRRIWRLPDVLEQTGLSRSTIYEMIGQGEFPRQINLGPRAVGWSSDEVLDWIDSKIREARSQGSRS